jgi:hypothetical protein
VTIPVTTVENKRSFSTIKPVEIFVRNAMGQVRLHALARLSTAKQLISSIRLQPGSHLCVLKNGKQENGIPLYVGC